MVAVNFNTTNEQRMFAILAAPQSKDKTLSEICKSGIATGSNTIADYLIIRLLQPRKIGKETINLIDVKNIPIRLQMLLSGQVSAALMPEPLATLAETKGAKALIDDKRSGTLGHRVRIQREVPQRISSGGEVISQGSQ